jgi:hypothetical protein
MAYGVLPEKGDEDAILDGIESKNRMRDQVAATATPELASRIGEIYRANPWMKPGEILALAKAGASDQLVNAASAQSGKQLTQRLDPNPPRKKNWFERNVYDPIKSAARYTFATLNLAPELAQNVGSQLLNRDNPAGFDGFFKSTSLGTMLAASKGEVDPATGQPITAGEGFFLGGTAAEKQSERARRFRGTINGSAWTLGRGAADVVFAPGTKAYSFLSGLIDASVAVFADPTLYGGKALKAARGAKAAIPAIQSAEEIAAFQKVAGVGELAAAGLSQAETVAWNSSKFRNWVTTNGKAQRLISTLVEKDDAYDIFSNVFKGKIDVAEAKRLADAKTTDEVLAIIGEQTNRMDAELSGLFPTDIRELVKFRERIPGYNNLRNSRLLTKMPEMVIKTGSSRDAVNAVNSYGNYLKSIGLNLTEGEGKDFMKEVMEVFADPNAAGSGRVNGLFENIVKKTVSDELTKGVGALVKADADEVATDLFRRVAQAREELRLYLINEAGEIDDFGLLQSLKDSGQLVFDGDLNPATLADLRLAGPGSLAELADKIQVLPDLRAVRRVTANPFIRRALSKQAKFADAPSQAAIARGVPLEEAPRELVRGAGQSRAAVTVADYLQNEVWKPLALMTGGYIFRNMFDAQIRMATVGKAGFFNHPIRYMQIVLGKALPESFIGRALDEEDYNRIAGKWDEYTDDFEEALSFGLRRNIDDPEMTYRRALRSNSMVTVSKVSNKPQYLKGLYEELRRLSLDQINNAVAKGIPTEELVTWLRNNQDPKAQKALRTLTRYLEGGLDVYDPGTQRMHTVRVAGGQVTDDVISRWINRLGNPRIDLTTGGDETLRFAVAHRRLPLAASETIDPRNFADADFVGGTLRRGVGSEVRLGVADGKEIRGVVTAVNSDTSWTVRRLSDNDVWDTALGQKELQDYIRGVYETRGNNLPRRVKYAPELGEADALGITQKQKEALQLWNRGVNFFFDNAYGRLSRKFERSPIYRQFYYEQFIENADLLTKEQAQLFKQSIEGRASALNVTKEALFGGKDQYDSLIAKLDSANGTGTVKQLEDYAGLRALNSTKETLFNAVERNNLEDILRIIVPFGPAWREVLKRYGSFLVEDPTRIRRAQLVYNGATNFDPDADGQGFFYKDPITGQNTFNIPFSGDLAKIITGVNAPLQAPVKGLSMGLQVIPSIGPVAQIAASELIPDTPSTDTIVGILLPYGRKQGGALVPGYVTKAYSALRDNPGKTESIYANTYTETVRALSASGEYNLEDPAEKERLLQDAKWRARVLTGFRALSQFLGPTSGTPEAIVETDKGDIYASYLLKAFQDLQAENYDTAVKRFLDIYGDDALLYVSSKTQAVQPGLAATEQFGDWENANEEILDAFPLVAAYFAPGGDDFSFSVWDRQIRTGTRKRLTAAEMIDLAQFRVGNAIYQDLKRQAGKYPPTEVKDWLRRQRENINKKLPGFPAKPVFTVGEFDRSIKEMKRAVDDPRLADNEIAGAVKEYLGYRDQAIADYVAAGGKEGGFATAKQAADLRQWLFNIGTALSEAVPDFQRVWDRELASEVDEL